MPASNQSKNITVSPSKGGGVEVTDSNLINGLTYYYGAFPYSDHNAFNTDDQNTVSETPSEQPVYKMWAFDQDFTNLDPETSITYPEGFENSDFKRLWANDSTINPDTEKNNSYQIDDWLPFLRETLRNIPYQISYDSEDENNCFIAEAEIDRNLEDVPGHHSFVYLTNGTKSQAQNPKYNGGLYAWLNKIYTKEIYSTDGNSRRVIFSDGPIDEDFYPIGFINSEGEELEGIWLPMGFRPIENNVYSNSYCALFFYDSSTSDYANIMPNYTYGTPLMYSPFAGHAGAEASFTLAGGILNIIRDLLYMMCKTTNIQEACGYNGSNASITSLPVTSHPQSTAVEKYGFWGERTYNDVVSNLPANTNRGWAMFYSQCIGSYLKDLIDRYLYLDKDGYLWYCPKYAKNALEVNYTNNVININKEVYIKTQIKNTTITGMNETGSGYGNKLIHVSKEFGSIPVINRSLNNSSDIGLCDLCRVGTSKNTFVTRFGTQKGGVNCGPACINFQYGSNYTKNDTTTLAMEVQLLLPPIGYKPYSE